MPHTKKCLYLVGETKSTPFRYLFQAHEIKNNYGLKSVPLMEHKSLMARVGTPQVKWKPDVTIEMTTRDDYRAWISSHRPYTFTIPDDAPPPGLTGTTVEDCPYDEAANTIRYEDREREEHELDQPEADEEAEAEEEASQEEPSFDGVNKGEKEKG